MTDLDKILEGLVQRTSDRKLQWSRSVNIGEFVTSVDVISVVVRELNQGYVPKSYYASAGSFAPPGHQLEIFDDEDNAVAVLETYNEHSYVSQDRGATPEQATQLAHLYELARRSALNTEATLQKLAKALEA